MMRVERITACARLSDPAELMSYAREAADAGDESWEQWVQEFERGDALVVALDLSIELANGATDELHASTRAFFIDCAVPTPHVERQIAEVAYEELVILVRDQLSAHGHQPDLLDGAPMYVHVALDREVRESLSNTAQRASSPPPPEPPPPGRSVTRVETPRPGSGMAPMQAWTRRLHWWWFPVRLLGRPGLRVFAAFAASR